MCGITGIIARKKRNAQDFHTVKRMMDVQRHRGPDDAGMAGVRFKEQNVRLFDGESECEENFDAVVGFNRLSILDLSDHGRQPMASPDGKVALAFNGEVYNAFDFKQGLMEKGYRFHSNTDTEIILALYLQEGLEGALEKLNGMYAIAIFDAGKNEAYFIRDRFGIKPLYLMISPEKIIFASELKSILMAPGIHKEVDLSVLSEYLMFRSTQPDSLLKGVEQLKPGEVMKYSFLEDRVSVRNYFSVNDYHRPVNKKLSFENIKLKTEEALKKSVNRQMISDVTVGCQLSGGVDSSLVACYASKENGLRDSVSIVFEDEAYSEKNYIDQAAARLNLFSHQFPLKEDYVFRNLERGVWHMDSIVSHPNSYGIMYLAEQAKKYVTVLLSGEGSDELMGGYPRFVNGYAVNQYLRSGFLRFLMEKSGINRKFIPSGRMDFASFAVESGICIGGGLLKSAFPDFRGKEVLEKRRALFHSLTGSSFDRQIKYELSTYLPELLIRQDKMSMAASIENRVPILDYEFVDDMFSVPEKALIHPISPQSFQLKPSVFFSGKYVLKELCADQFGRKFAYRKKSGFPMPVSSYLQSEKMLSYLADAVWGKMKNRGILRTDMLLALLKHVGHLTEQQSDLLWKCVSFEIWCQLFLDGRNYEIL